MEEDFYKKVYFLVKQIPKGYVTTYGEIAKCLGNKNMSRQVGQALHHNKNSILIPCHRVVFKDGSLSSSYAFGGKLKQKEKLLKEGINFCDDKVDLKNHFYKIV